MQTRKVFALMAAGGAIGVVAAFMQTLEELQLLKHANAALSCDLNSVFSCSNVLNAWQSSVFGFPNSILCLVLFVVFTTVAVAGWTRAVLSRSFRLGVQGLSLFTLGFGLWFLQQSTFSIRALCIFCLLCFVGLLIVNWAWLRINAADLPVITPWKQWLHRGIQKGADTFGWIVLGLLVGLVLVLKFG